MTADTSDRRLARRIGALAALVGLGGCSDLLGGTGSSGTDRPATGSGGKAATDGSGTGVAEGDGSDCETASTDRRDELERLRSELDDVEAELAAARLRKAAAVARRGRYPGAFDDATLERARETGDRIAESVVAFDLPGEDLRWGRGGAGTGWFRRPREVVTNAHVVRSLREATDEDLSGVACVTRDGDRLGIESVRTSQDPLTDVAVLETDGEREPLSTGSAADLEPEQPLVGVANPTAFGDWTVSVGRYVGDFGGEAAPPVGLGGLADPPDNWFVSAVPVRNGSSGSPVATLDGSVVGLTSLVPSMGDDEPGPTPVEPSVRDRPFGRLAWAGHQAIETVEAWIESG